MDPSTVNSLTAVSVILILAAALIVGFARGWIFTAFQVKTLLDLYKARADDYKTLYEVERAKNDSLVKQLDTLTVVGEAVNKLLSIANGEKVT